MGLDIYLSRNANFEDSRRREAEYQKRKEDVWESYYTKEKEQRRYEELLPEEVNEARDKCKAIAAELNLDEYGSDNNEESIRLDSKKHPDHMFKIGYFRSSYNDGGINSVLRKMIGADLYSIFDISTESYYVFPDWNRVKERIAQVRHELDSIKQDCGGYVTVVTTRSNIFQLNAKLPQSAQEAINIFREEAITDRKYKTENPSQYENYGGAYGSSKGDFFFKEPLRVKAIIPAMEVGLLSQRKELVHHLITEYSDFQWYLDALDIIEETADWVMSQPNPEQFHTRWSG